jgi:hypothetical protein
MLMLDRGPNARKCDYVRIPDAAGLTPGGDFTLEFFKVKFTTTTGTQALYCHNNASGNQRSLFLQWVSGTGLQAGLSTDGTSGAGQTIVNYNWTPTTGTEYDICLERSGTTVRIYVDGAVGNSGTRASGLFNTTDPAFIGIFDSSGTLNNQFSGQCQAMRFTVGVARYNGAYTPPTLPLPSS